MKETKRTITVTLPSDKEVVITRVFDAPRDLVFKAFTDPKLIPHWWGPRKYKTTVDKMDVRPGGAWRFVHRDEEGNEHGFRGVYRGSPRRSVSSTLLSGKGYRGTFWSRP